MGLSGLMLFWRSGFVEFDEMLQQVVFRRWLRKFITAKVVTYADIKHLVLKRYAHEDEEGYVTHEGYFHLELNNGQTYLLMVFNDDERIEQARRHLTNHTRLNIRYWNKFSMNIIQLHLTQVMVSQTAQTVLLEMHHQLGKKVVEVKQ